MRLLGRILGDMVRKQSGETVFGTVEGITSNQILSSVFVTPSLPGATVSLSSATLSGRVHTERTRRPWRATGSSIVRRRGWPDRRH